MRPSCYPTTRSNASFRLRSAKNWRSLNSASSIQSRHTRRFLPECPIHPRSRTPATRPSIRRSPTGSLCRITVSSRAQRNIGQLSSTSAAGMPTVSHRQRLEGKHAFRPSDEPGRRLLHNPLAKNVNIQASIGCHTFRATGITTYFENDGTLEHAQAMATHESLNTTKLYDRTKERLTLDEIERIRR